MKVAICISGNFREYKNSLPSIINLTSQFDICDIFMVYDVSENINDVKNVVRILNPKQIKQVHSIHNCNNLNMWYKIKESYLLCENYSEQHKMNYDLIFRTRYDIKYCTIYDLTKIKYDDKTLYVPYLCEFNVINNLGYIIDDFLRDDIFFGKPATMKIFMNFYDVIKDSKNNCSKYSASECYFNKYLNLMKYDYKRVSFRCSLLKHNNATKLRYEKIKKNPRWIIYFLFNKYVVVLLIILIYFIYFTIKI